MSPTATSDQNMPVFAHQVAALLAKQRREDLELIGATLRRRGFKIDTEEPSAPMGQTVGARSKIIDFHAASPILRRDRQGGGIRIPHFSMKPITRTVPPTKGRKTLAGSKARMTAGEHFDYVRDGARIEMIGHLDYIRRQVDQWDLQRDCLIDMLDEPVIRADLNEQAYWSNIEGDVRRHRSLFETAEAVETKPKTYSLIASTADTDALERAARREDATDWFRQAVIKLGNERERARQRAAEAGKPFRDIKAAITTVSSEVAFDQLTWTASQPDIAKLIGYEQGRSGRIQTRFVLELPSRIGPEKRAIILHRFCQSLADDGWMVAGAIHLAEQTNDRRNDHIHVDAYDRPARWLDEHQCWDFAYTSRVNSKITHPHRQDKVRYDEPPAKLLRNRFIQIVNEVVDGQQDVPIFVTGTYAQNDIELTPLEHMGSRASGLERRGIRTDVGRRNAARVFADDIDACERAGEIAERNLDRRIGPLFTLVSHDPHASIALDEYDRIEREIIRRETDAKIAAVIAEMARSRADTVLQTLNPAPGYRPKTHVRNKELRQAAKEHLGWVDRTAPSSEEHEAEHTELQERLRRSAQLMQIVQQAVDPSARRERMRSFIYYQARSKDGHSQAKATPFDEQVKGRLLRWLAQHERDPSRLIFDGNTVSLAQSVPKTIGTMMGRFFVEHDVQDRLFEEMDRRIFIASFAAQQSSNIAAASELRGASASAPKRDVEAPTTQTWVEVPNPECITRPLHQREPEMLAALERRDEPAMLDVGVAQQPGSPPEPAVSHEKLTEAGVVAVAAPASPKQPVPSDNRATDLDIPPATKETDDAARPDYHSALREVRRRLAAREPDHRETVSGPATHALSGVRGLSKLGLVDRLDGPPMLLHGLPPDQFSDAARPDVGGGDGLRRPRDGDRRVEEAAGGECLSASPANTPSIVQGASPRLELRGSTRPRTQMDALRDEARKRAQSKQSGQASSGAKHANEAIPDSPAPNDRRQSATPVGPMPSAAIKVPAASPSVVTIQQSPSVGRSVARPQDRDVRVPSSAPKMDAQAHRALLAELAKQYLPLREVTQSEGGRERTLVILIDDLAVSDDADLIRQAIAQQHLAQYQEQFRDRYDAFLAGVRATLMGRPATNPENWRAVLNPENDARLAAAIAAAEASPSFKALIPTAKTHQAVEGLSMVKQQMTDIRRGHGSRT